MFNIRTYKKTKAIKIDEELKIHVPVYVGSMRESCHITHKNCMAHDSKVIPADAFITDN